MLRPERFRLLAPKAPMIEEGGLVHEQGPGVGQVDTEAVEDGQPVGVQVPPIVAWGIP